MSIPAGGESRSISSGREACPNIRKLIPKSGLVVLNNVVEAIDDSIQEFKDIIEEEVVNEVKRKATHLGTLAYHIEHSPQDLPRVVASIIEDDVQQIIPYLEEKVKLFDF